MLPPNHVPMPLRLHRQATHTAIHVHAKTQEGESRRNESILSSTSGNAESLQAEDEGGKPGRLVVNE
eukprot:1097655-Pleurochrysis_carterae.AAC.1